MRVSRRCRPSCRGGSKKDKQQQPPTVILKRRAWSSEAKASSLLALFRQLFRRRCCFHVFLMYSSTTFVESHQTKALSPSRGRWTSTRVGSRRLGLTHDIVSMSACTTSEKPPSENLR